MMDWTDRHCRYFHRLLTKRTHLYTEMVTTGALLHGDVVAAFKFNPLLVLSLPFLFYAFVRFTNAAIQARQLKGNQLDAKYIWTIFGAVLFFWIFRNTPFYPFAS